MEHVQLADFGSTKGIIQYKISRLILLAVSQVSFLENCWNLEVGYLWGGIWLLGPTDGFGRGLSNYSNVYSEVSPLMFDYSKPSNEVGSLNGSGTKCTPETG